MDTFPLGQVLAILALILVNGFFAMAELAIVSSRRPRLESLAARGSRGAVRALRLSEEPGRFLSSIQIGITLVGVATGAVSGAALAAPMGELLDRLGLPARISTEAGFLVVVAIVTYVTLILGELVPKQLALRNPESLAARVAPVMAGVARVMAPIVWALDRSVAAVFRLLRLRRESDAVVTEEELRSMMAEADAAGVLDAGERDLLSGIMRLADRRVRGVMTPRVEVEWLEILAPADEVRARLLATQHSRLVVGEGSIDRAVGVVQARAVLASMVRGEEVRLQALVEPAPVVPDVADALAVLETLRAASVPMALVVDEYGAFEGIVTPADLLAAIAGDFQSDLEANEGPDLTERADGSLLVAGSMPADEMAERLRIRLDEERDYQTVAGFALAVLEHLPREGEAFVAHGWHFEVVDMDGRKIDKLLVRPLETGDDAGPGA